MATNTILPQASYIARFPIPASRPRPAILQQIGNTPLLPLQRLTRDLPPTVKVYVKAEWFNPGGSVKDRPALRMIEQAILRGDFRPGMTLIDATSGNTGIGYALVGAALGFPVTLVMPENVSEERKRIARAYGAEVILTPEDEGVDGAIRYVHDQVARRPDRFYHPDQYNNPDNWLAHYHGTGPEIWRQTGGRVTHFVTALGTTGAFMGVGRYLKAKNSAIQLISVEPVDAANAIEGVKHMATSIVPGIYDPRLKDGEVRVTKAQAVAMARRLARGEGLFVGFSAGAAVHSALQTARQLDEGVVVTLLADGGMKYVSVWE
ncbi:MAG TPA: cysteine synthase family protein [Anaerolineae bacterium]|nr:cysteine synthase family protein [Caldilineae bacterium]HID34887.1 cysteine synthase family protein [Anaerolineae bacterium]HIQ12336.1 cysteine synthase family protein [Caldilineales bacterium]